MRPRLPDTIFISKTDRMSDMISDLHTDAAAVHQEKCIQRCGDFDNIAVVAAKAHGLEI